MNNSSAFYLVRYVSTHDAKQLDEWFGGAEQARFRFKEVVRSSKGVDVRLIRFRIPPLNQLSATFRRKEVAVAVLRWLGGPQQQERYIDKILDVDPGRVGAIERVREIESGNQSEAD